MADVTSKVCDICGQPDVTVVTIKEGRRVEFVVDLCAKHMAPIDKLRDKGRSAQGRRPYKRYKVTSYVDRALTDS